jgi:hypothetical protein
MNMKKNASHISGVQKTKEQTKTKTKAQTKNN